MRRYRLVFVAFLMVSLTVFCVPPEGGHINGSGNVVIREWGGAGSPLSEFDRIHATHFSQMVIRQGDSYGVIIHTDDNLVPFLKVVVVEKILCIGMEDNRRMGYSSTMLRAEVAMRSLTELHLSRGISATITDFDSWKPFVLWAPSTGSLQGDIRAGDVHVSGVESTVILTGSGQDLTVVVSLGSVVDLSDFLVNNANVVARSGSMITVNPTGMLDVQASGASQVFYVGDPTLGSIDTDETSSVGRK